MKTMKTTKETKPAKTDKPAKKADKTAKTDKAAKEIKKPTRAVIRHTAKTAKYKALYDLVGDLATELADLRMSGGYSKLCPIDKHICDMELAAYDQLSAVLRFKIRWAEARCYAPNGDDLHRGPEAQAAFIGNPVSAGCGKCKGCKDCKDACTEKAKKDKKGGKCPHCGDDKAPAKKAEKSAKAK